MLMKNFQKAKRQACKASILIEGLTGKGKTGLALMLAYYLTDENWEKVGLIDTENNSALLFEGIQASFGAKFGEFLHAQLTADVGFKPTNYLALRKEAVKEYGCEAVISDSISHAWQYQGGILDMVTTVTANSTRADKYQAWGDQGVVKEKNELLTLIRDPKTHVISTVRVKEKFEYADVDGKKKLVSLGEQQIQQGDLKYEPDLVLHMLRAGSNINGEIKHPQVRVIKSRYTLLQEDQIYDITPALCKDLVAYLKDGVDPEMLLKKQHAEYVEVIKGILDKTTTKKAIWGALKEQQGHKDTPLEQIPLSVLKKLYVQLSE